MSERHLTPKEQEVMRSALRRSTRPVYGSFLERVIDNLPRNAEEAARRRAAGILEEGEKS